MVQMVFLKFHYTFNMCKKVVFILVLLVIVLEILSFFRERDAFYAWICIILLASIFFFILIVSVTSRESTESIVSALLVLGFLLVVIVALSFVGYQLMVESR